MEKKNLFNLLNILSTFATVTNNAQYIRIRKPVFQFDTNVLRHEQTYRK